MVATASNALFAQLASVISGHDGNTFLAGESLAKLTLRSCGQLSVVYAPFDYVSPSADLVIVGITPGRAQAENALAAARQALRAGQSLEEALTFAKRTASFSGPQTRANLVAMLDHIGLHAVCGLASSARLFEDGSKRVHFSSALRYPVFIDGRNYGGAPDMVRTPLLREMIEIHLAAEARALSAALWLPLGPKPARALQHLVGLGVLDHGRVLAGLPHPSGLNGERVAAFLGRIRPDEVSRKTRPERLLQACDMLREQVAALPLTPGV